MTEQTVGELRDAIKKASLVLIRPRFGTSERWVQITKREATHLVVGLSRSAKCSEMEMDKFFRWSGDGEGDELCLG